MPPFSAFTSVADHGSIAAPAVPVWPRNVCPAGLRLNALKTVFGIDLRTLALFRVMVALMILADLISRARDLTAHYTDAGILPRAEHLRLPGGWRWSLHLLSGSATVEAVLFAIAAVIALALLVGYRTRLVTVLSWLFLASLQARNPTLIQGGDNLLLLLLFWGMFLPLGARFAIDAALDRSASEAPERLLLGCHRRAPHPGHVGLLLQCAAQDPRRSGGPTGQRCTSRCTSTTLPRRSAVWFRQFSPVLTGLTYYVWVLELIGPILMFLPVGFPWLRLALQAMFITMHIGFFLSLEIGLFPFISITSLLVFTPGCGLGLAAAGACERRRAPGFRIYYDGDCEFCRKVCLILRTMLLLPAVPIREAQGDANIHAEMQAHNSWVVVDHDGTRHVRWQALALVFRRSPLFAPARRVDGCPGPRAPRRPGVRGSCTQPVRSRSAHRRLASEPRGTPSPFECGQPCRRRARPRRAVDQRRVLARLREQPAENRERHPEHACPRAEVEHVRAVPRRVGWLVRGTRRHARRNVVDVLKRTKGEPDFFGPAGSRASTRPTAGASTPPARVFARGNASFAVCAVLMPHVESGEPDWWATRSPAAVLQLRAGRTGLPAAAQSADPAA